MSAILVDIEAVPIDAASDYLEPIEPDPDLLKPIEPDSRLKDPVKVAENLAKVERLRAERPALIEASIKERTEKAVEKCSLDPDLCRIVALGHGEATGSDHVILCRDEETERAALRAFWDHVINAAGGVQTLVGFNSFGYDLPVLLRRSQLLSVDHPPISLDRYRSPHIDLMQRLTFNGAIKAHSLKFYASRFGMPVEDNVDGSQIAALVKAGDWAGVESHCRSDLKLTRFLAQKLKLIESTSPVMVA